MLLPHRLQDVVRDVPDSTTVHMSSGSSDRGMMLNNLKEDLNHNLEDNLKDNRKRLENKLNQNVKDKFKDISKNV